MLEHPERGLRIVEAAGGRRASKQQQRFARLVKEAARLKEAVRAWSAAQGELSRGVAEHERRLGEYRAAIGALLRLFDRGCEHRALTKRERAYLRRILCDTARDLLQEEDDDEELKAIYNRHSRGDYDAEIAEANAMQARVIRGVLEMQFGFDFGSADIRSVDDLQRETVSQIEELDREAAREEEAAAANRARRKKSARQVAAEARREAEQARIGKSLQDVYRKLAVALHPDREPDPEERARKTSLMQQINVAYEAKDLLQLLELQLRFEQIDEAQIGDLADERLAHYNRLLAEQVGQLKEELAAIELPWRFQLGLPPTGKLPPARALARQRDELRGVSLRVEQARHDLEELAEPARLKAWIQRAMADEAQRNRELLDRL